MEEETVPVNIQIEEIISEAANPVDTKANY